MKPIVKSTLMASALSGLLCCAALAQQTQSPETQPAAQPLQPDFSKVEIKPISSPTISMCWKAREAPSAC